MCGLPETSSVEKWMHPSAGRIAFFANGNQWTHQGWSQSSRPEMAPGKGTTSCSTMVNPSPSAQRLVRSRE